MTTRTEWGILPPGSLIALAEHRQIERARVHAVDEHPERDVLVVAALGDAVEHFERLLERVRIRVREVPGMLEREHHAVRLLPRALGEHVVQRVPVVAEPLGEREPLAERREQPLLGAHPGEVDDPAREPRALGRGVEGGRVLGANEDPGLAGVDQQLLVIHGARPRRERSLAHAPERPVVIARVIVLARRADVAAFARPSDDPPRSAIVRAGRRHRVLAVIAPAARGQLVLEVAKDRSVLPVRKRPTALDQRERFARFRRQRRGRDFRNRLRPFARDDRDRKRQETDGAEERGAGEPGGAQCRLRETHDEPVAPWLRRLRLRRLAQPDVELPQLPLVDRRGRLRQQVLRALRLRERDDVADRLGSGYQRGEAIETERDPAVRRRAVPEGVEPECELLPRLRLADRERPEDLLLDLGAVDPHRAAADLPAVQHDVVRLRERGAGIGFEQPLVPLFGTRERMVHRDPALRLAPSPYSTSGKSTIHAGRQPASAKPFSWPIRARSAPSESLTILARSAPKKIRSPAAAAVRSRMPRSASPGRNLTIGDCRPSSLAFDGSFTLRYARPFAP